MNAQPAPDNAAEPQEVYLDRSRVEGPEILGMVSGVVLILSLWLPWYSTSAANVNSKILSAGIGPGQSADAWETFSSLQWLLLLLGLAPFILAWIVARGHKLGWRPGEVTMIAGMTGVVLVFGNGVIFGKPKPNIDISLDIGWWVALLACIGIVVGGFRRQAAGSTAARKPPGTV